MRIALHRLLILTSIAIPLHASAQWSSDGIRYIQRFNQGASYCKMATGVDDPAIAKCETDYMRGGGYVETLSGTIGLIAKSGGLDVTYPGERKIDVALPGHFFSAPDGSDMSIRLSYWQPPIPNPRRAPLIIYLPGIFQDASIAHSARAVELLVQNGYQVLLIPNPLSGDYMDRFPNASPGSFEQEVAVIYHVIAWAKQHLVSPDASLGIVGASYGAFLGSILVGSVDKYPNLPSLINGQVTLLAMPLNMNTTMKILDRYVDTSIRLTVKSFSWQKAIEARFGKLTSMMLDWFVEDDINWKVPEFSYEQLGANFHVGLQNLVYWMQRNFIQRERYGVSDISYAPTAEEVYRNFDWDNKKDVNTIRFRWIVTTLEPENVAFYGTGFDSVQAKSGYWLNRALQSGFERFRVLEADDDPLNDPKEYSDLSNPVRAPSHLVVRTSGGHAGFIAQQMLADFVRIEFAGRR